MCKRILAITFIYACTSLGWIILAGSTMLRTKAQDIKLTDTVGQLWGTAQSQQAPWLCYMLSKPEAKNVSPKTAECIPLDASNIQVDLKLEHRKKGLLWYSTYRVKFAGKYRIANSSEGIREVFLNFMLPAKNAVYDNFNLAIGGQEIKDIEPQSGVITTPVRLAAGQNENVEISYESQGLNEWSYNMGVDVKAIRNFSLVVTTDFEEIDFPAQSISPAQKERTNKGWKLTWQYSNLLTGANIGVIMPQKLNPGPWVSRVTSAAPVSLFLFFFLLFVFTTIKNIKIHPMNYFFVGTAFFSFHLLLAYLVDHVSIHLSFWICSLVSVLLVVSYMRLVLGSRFTFTEIITSQLVYLVVFSYTFFFRGYTGLAITILCICTLFVVMQLTGKVDWDKVFAKSDKKTTTGTLG
jgi:inner membrane protein involved in colicin E2 resistance